VNCDTSSTPPAATNPHLSSQHASSNVAKTMKGQHVETGRM